MLLVFIAVQTGLVSSLPMQNLLVNNPDAEGTAATARPQTATADNTISTEWAKAVDTAAPVTPQLDIDYVQMLLRNMSQAERQKILSDADLFKQAIENEANNHSVLIAAKANNLDQDTNIAFLMQRGADNILREAYLNRLIANQLPEDFPSDEQAQEYYQNNESQFVLPERVHVWQIFFQKPVDGDEASIKQVRDEAARAYEQLKQGKSEFAELAATLSQHQQSRANGGYMGLIKLPELLPEVREPLLNLKEGKLGGPVESESGFHILKRGRIVESETVGFQEVKDQIRQLLLRQAQRQLRNAIYIQAQKEYPQSIPAEKIEEWRLRLKTDTVKK